MRSTLPALARTARGWKKSAVPGRAERRPRRPAASATRTIAPRLPGSWMPKTKTTGPGRAEDLRDGNVAAARDRQQVLRRLRVGEALEHGARDEARIAPRSARRGGRAGRSRRGGRARAGCPAATASRIAFSPSSRKCVRSSRLRAISRMSGFDGRLDRGHGHHAITARDEIAARRGSSRRGAAGTRPRGSPLSALWTFPAMIGAAFVVAWGAEAAEFLMSQGLALAILALDPDDARVRGRGGHRLEGRQEPGHGPPRDRELHRKPAPPDRASAGR